MMEFRFMNDPTFNVSYGLGTMNMYYDSRKDPTKDVYPNYDQYELIGHAGADWGSGSQLLGYNFKAKVAVVYTQATAFGMNCSLEGDDYYQNYGFS